MLVAFWDTETDGLLNELTKIHCLAIAFSDGRFMSCADQPGYPSVVEGLKALEEADLRIAHNGQDFDERAVRKVYPWWKPKGGVLDTLLLSRLVYPDIFKDGPNSHRVIGHLKKAHSLKAWGLRLGEHKGDYSGGWETWSPEMQRYMDQDVLVLKKLFNWLIGQKPSKVSVALEHDFAAIIRRQEARGFTFDMPFAMGLLASLSEQKTEIESEVIDTYGEWWQPGRVTAARASRKQKIEGYPDVEYPRLGKNGKALRPYVGPPVCYWEEGAPYTPITRVQFNPGSRDHVRLMLKQRHGWVPLKKTDKGAAVVDDEILRALDFPEAPRLADYYLVDKIMGTVKGLIKAAKTDGEEVRVYGTVNTNGAVTGRCTHRVIVNIPAGKAKPGQPIEKVEYGKKVRHCFIARRGYTLCGFDAAAIELRMLAHFVAQWDGGVYARIVDEGDPHAWTRDLVGTDLLGEAKNGRENAKTIIYAFIYGAGSEKLGSIVKPQATKREKIALGSEVKEKLFSRFEALGKLQQAVTGAVEERGFLIGLDGRKLRIRKAHAAVNTLLQSAGAVVMKKSLVILDQSLQASGFECGRDYEFVANVHDEAQAEVLPSHVERYLELATRAIPLAGTALNVKCPLKAEAKAGHSWASTH